MQIPFAGEMACSNVAANVDVSADCRGQGYKDILLWVDLPNTLLSTIDFYLKRSCGRYVSGEMGTHLQSDDDNRRMKPIAFAG